MKQAFQITILFKQSFLAQQDAKDEDSVVNLLHSLHDVFAKVNVVRRTADGGAFQVEGEDKAQVMRALERSLAQMGAKDAVEVQPVKSIDKMDEKDTVQDEAGKQAAKTQSENAPEDAEKPARKDFVPIKPEAEAEMKCALAEIQKLVGADEFKAVAEELAMMAGAFLRNDTWGMMSKRCYLFSVEDGCGFSRQCTLFAQLLEELSLGSYSRGIREFSADTPLEKMRELSEKTASLCFISYDLSEWLGKENQPEFRQFLRALEKTQRRRIYAFRIPYVDKSTGGKMYQAISDIFMVQSISAPPLTMSQLREFAQQTVAEKGYTLSDAAWAAMQRHVIAEKSDGRFWGFNTMRKIIRVFLYEKQRNVAVSGNQENEMLLDEASIPPAPEMQESSLTALEQLDQLVGIEPIRERLLEVVSQIELARRTSGVVSPCLHMRFVGSPGTGKTTIARLLGQLLKERGVLSKGMFFEIAGRDLCGRYIGETAPKTAAYCRDAYGSVLFIDEAYSLYHGDDHSWDFGREAIDTLIAQMENHKEDFVVIMAGYEDNMETLMKANTGLASRIPYTIEFPNYDRKALADIYMKMAEKSFACAPDLQPAVEGYFDALTDHRLNDDSFANARFVRNLFERTWGKAAIRHQLEPEQALTLTACDFEQATVQREFKELQTKTSKRIGFMP